MEIEQTEQPRKRTYTLQKAADLLGKSTHTVKAVAQSLGIETGERRTYAFTEEALERMRTFLEAGDRLRETLKSLFPVGQMNAEEFDSLLGKVRDAYGADLTQSMLATVISHPQQSISRYKQQDAFPPNTSVLIRLIVRDLLRNAPSADVTQG